MLVKEAYDRAVELGIKNICITNHHETSETKNNNFHQSMTDDKLRRYKAEVQELKKDKRTNISFGIEMGYTEENEDTIRDFLAKNNFDFVLGSLHYVNKFMIGNPKTRAEITPKDRADLCSTYFKLLKKAIKTRLFDVMSHIDLYKRVMPEPDFESVRGEWEDVATLLVKNNIGFEINTSYSKIVPDGTYPGTSIIKIMIDKGVKLITIGSDAHKIDNIGRDIEKVEALLKNMGVNTIYRFEKRKPIPLDLL